MKQMINDGVSAVTPTFSRRYKSYVLVILSSVYMLNLVDRALVSLLLQPIKIDLKLSDTQLGFITGIAFALFYATLGVPIARWSDRGDRRLITSLAIGLWGLTVMAFLLVGSFVQIVAARIAAAVGEAGCKPPTYSLLGDYFPDPAERNRAMAVYLGGNSIAGMLAFIVGGWLNELYGWRVTFFVMGIPGLVLAVVVWLTVTEPRSTKNLETDPPHQLPFVAVLRNIWGCRSTRHITIALVLLYTVGQGMAPWYAAFLMRSHGMQTGELGLWLGSILGLGGLAGTLLGGFVASRYFVNREDLQMRFSALAVALIVPCVAVFLLAPQKQIAILAMLPLVAAFSIFLAPTYTLMQQLVPDNLRATVLAIIMLLANLLGMGLGPQLVGIFSDLLNPKFGDDSLRYAMLLVSIAGLWASCHYWLGSLSVRRDLEEGTFGSTVRAGS